MADGIHVSRIAHFGIRVRDLERSRAFYELLGFRLTAGPMGPEPVAILENSEGVELNLVINATGDGEAVNVLMDVDEKHPGITHVALMIDDLDAARQHLEAAGVAITGGPVEFPNGVRAIFVRDPDRNVIELDEPAAAASS